ncbi:hypothetical protein D3C80_1852830 [compost metagenome]
MFAEAAQGFFQAQAFEQGQAEGLAGAFILPGGILYRAIAEGARLVVIVLGDKGQGLGKGELVAMQVGAEVVQGAHALGPLSLALVNAACCSALASFWYLLFHSLYGMP